ncbi:hypothetical protein REPUB_Repub07fG0050100 [Reevesia pubescens]
MSLGGEVQAMKIILENDSLNLGEMAKIILIGKILFDSPLNRRVKEIDFSRIQYLVQIHNLPFDMLTKKNAEVIRKALGDLVNVDHPE